MLNQFGLKAEWSISRREVFKMAGALVCTTVCTCVIGCASSGGTVTGTYHAKVASFNDYYTYQLTLRGDGTFTCVTKESGRTISGTWKIVAKGDNDYVEFSEWILGCYRYRVGSNRLIGVDAVTGKQYTTFTK